MKLNIRYLIISAFLIVPILSSFISTIHLIDLFSLGNTLWLAILLSIVYEVGSITSFIIPIVLDKINKNIIWSIFSILLIMQIFGNIYFSFNYINVQLAINKNWLYSFSEILSYFIGSDISLVKIILSCLIGLPIPLISLFFLKSLMEYIKKPEHIEKEISSVVGTNIRK